MLYVRADARQCGNAIKPTSGKFVHASYICVLVTVLTLSCPLLRRDLIKESAAEAGTVGVVGTTAAIAMADALRTTRSTTDKSVEVKGLLSGVEGQVWGREG